MHFNAERSLYTNSLFFNYITQKPPPQIKTALQQINPPHITATPISQSAYNILNDESSLTKIESAFIRPNTPLMISRLKNSLLVLK